MAGQVKRYSQVAVSAFGPSGTEWPRRWRVPADWRGAPGACRAGVSARRCVLLVLIVLLQGCSASSVVRGVDGMRHRYRFDDLDCPGLTLIRLDWNRQPTANACGPSCVASVLAYFESPDAQTPVWTGVSEAMLAEHDAKWTLPELRDYCRGQGYPAFIVPACSPADLQTWIRAGWPVLVPLTLPYSKEFHLVAVVGFNNETSSYVVMDPLVGWQAFRERDVLARWAGRQHAALLVLPKGSTTREVRAWQKPADRAQGDACSPEDS